MQGLLLEQCDIWGALPFDRTSEFATQQTGVLWDAIACRLDMTMVLRGMELAMAGATQGKNMGTLFLTGDDRISPPRTLTNKQWALLDGVRYDFVKVNYVFGAASFDHYEIYVVERENA